MQLPQRREEDVGEAEHEGAAFGHAVRRELLDGGVEEEEGAVEDEAAGRGVRVREAGADRGEEGVRKVPAGRKSAGARRERRAMLRRTIRCRSRGERPCRR